jgi:hypothetical protein
MAASQKLAPPQLMENVGITRQCPYCGKFVSKNLSCCPNCRETMPNVLKVEAAPAAKRGQIRRGLLYMLMAAVIHFFAGGYSAMELPYPIAPVVTIYLSPLLFLGGLGLTLYGLYMRNKQ